MMKKRLFLRLPAFGTIFLFCCCTFATKNIFSQVEAKQVKITVRILNLGYTNITDKGKNKPVWKFYNGDIDKNAKELTNYKKETCFTLKKTKKNNKAKELDDDEQELNPFLASPNGFVLTMEAFISSKGGDLCKWDSKDKNRGTKVQNFSLDKLNIGQWSDTVRIEDNSDGGFWSEIKYKYSLIQGLGDIDFSGNDNVKDANNNVVLSLSFPLPNKEKLPVSWQYSRGNNNWITLPNVKDDKSSIDFNPLHNIFDGKLNGLEKVSFRAEANIENKINFTEILTLSFTPAPPYFDENDKQVFNACSGMANGKIQIRNIKSNMGADINYVLQKKDDTNETCKLQDPTVDDCPGFITNGKIAKGNSLEIKNLPAGDYNLYLFDADVINGAVSTVKNFKVGETRTFKISEVSSTDPTCINENTGEIRLTVDKGEGIWQIVIFPNKGKLYREGNNIIFKNLTEGIYTVYLTDQCGKEEKKTCILKKPEKLGISIAKAETGNDEFYVQLKIKNGSGKYKVHSTDPATFEMEIPFVKEINLPITEEGTYTFRVSDNENPGCTPVTKSIKVEKTDKSNTAKFKFTELPDSATGN